MLEKEEKEEEISKEYTNNIKKNKYPRIAYYCGKYGWTVAIPFLFGSAVVNNNVLNLVIIVALFIGIWIPKHIQSHRYVRATFFPFVVFAVFVEYLYQNAFIPHV